MKVRLPQSKARRADVLVASLMWLWLAGWGIADLLGRTGAGISARSSSGLLILLLGTWTLESLLLLGVAFGDRRSFGALAALSFMGFVGSFTMPLMAQRPITALHVLNAVVEGGLFFYLCVRLREGRTLDDSVPAERSSTVRFGNAFVGGLNAAWALWFMVTVLAAQIPAHRLRGTTDYRAEICIEGVGLLYLVLCGAIVQGRRWAFVAIAIALGFFALGEVGLIFSVRYPSTIGLILLAALHAGTAAYACFRLRGTRPPVSTVP